MRAVNFTAGLILGGVVAVFALQNSGPVEVRFLIWQAQSSVALVVLSALGIGLAAALLVGIPEVVSARWRIRSLERGLHDRARDDVGVQQLREAA